MTAVDVDALDKLRARVAAGLTHANAQVPPETTDFVRDFADALLPVVDRIANERAAAELRAAADDSRIIARTWQQSLLARADALDPS